MRLTTSIKQHLNTQGLTCQLGYPDDKRLPIVFVRPAALLNENPNTIDGNEMVYTESVSVFCISNSLEACNNLSFEVYQALQSFRHEGVRANLSIVYVSTKIDGLYESQVSVSLLRGEL